MTATEKDLVILADAVNQLAISVESMLSLTRNSGLYKDDARRIRDEVRGSLRRQREAVASIIERHDP
jgi:hypothetical protein